MAFWFIQVCLFLFVLVRCVTCVQPVDDVLGNVHRIVNVENIVADAAEDDVVSMLLVVVADIGIDGVAEKQAVLFVFDNIYSLYHKQSNEIFGKESKTTYHWQFREEQKFFLDYTFTNIDRKSVV